MPALLRDIFDVLMPPICSVCGNQPGRRTDTLCSRCRAGFDPIGRLVCPLCGKPVPQRVKRRCPDCPQPPVYFQTTRAAYHFRGVLRDVIHAFKYAGCIELGRELACAMHAGLPEYGCDTASPSRATVQLEPFPDPADDILAAPPPRPEALIPVPMHYLRRLHRGYNHSEELARQFAALVHLPCEPTLLVRWRRTKRQALLEPEKRLENIRGAFQIPRPDLVQGRRLALVDDVFTSGSTVNECARVLMAAGAQSVTVLTLARA